MNLARLNHRLVWQDGRRYALPVLQRMELPARDVPTAGRVWRAAEATAGLLLVAAVFFMVFWSLLA